MEIDKQVNEKHEQKRIRWGHCDKNWNGNFIWTTNLWAVSFIFAGWLTRSWRMVRDNCVPRSVTVARFSQCWSAEIRHKCATCTAFLEYAATRTDFASEYPAITLYLPIQQVHIIRSGSLKMSMVKLIECQLRWAQTAWYSPLELLFCAVFAGCD